jgi:hypothetical protein
MINRKELEICKRRGHSCPEYGDGVDTLAADTGKLKCGQVGASAEAARFLCEVVSLSQREPDPVDFLQGREKFRFDEGPDPGGLRV